MGSAHLSPKRGCLFMKSLYQLYPGLLLGNGLERPSSLRMCCTVSYRLSRISGSPLRHISTIHSSSSCSSSKVNTGSGPGLSPALYWRVLISFSVVLGMDHFAALFYRSSFINIDQGLFHLLTGVLFPDVLLYTWQLLVFGFIICVSTVALFMFHHSKKQ